MTEFLYFSFYKNNLAFYSFTSIVYLFGNFIPIGVILYYLKKYTHVFEVSSENLTSLQKLKSKFKITEREMEVIRLLIRGKTNKEISNLLYISEKTVKNNLTSIFKKTETRNRVELTGLATNQ
jgi:DNA-binding NarL/FixJ family response regulator